MHENWNDRTRNEPDKKSHWEIKTWTNTHTHTHPNRQQHKWKVQATLSIQFDVVIIFFGFRISCVAIARAAAFFRGWPEKHFFYSTSWNKMKNKWMPKLFVTKHLTAIRLNIQPHSMFMHCHKSNKLYSIWIHLDYSVRLACKKKCQIKFFIFVFLTQKKCVHFPIASARKHIFFSHCDNFYWTRICIYSFCGV